MLAKRGTVHRISYLPSNVWSFVVKSVRKNTDESMPNLTLFDQKSRNTYILHVSEEEFAKANKDMLFATHLLEKTLYGSQTQTINDQPEASTSSCDEKQQYSSTGNDNMQELCDTEEKDSFRWPHAAILLLIEVYKEHEDKITSGKMSVKKLWNMVSSMLIEKGYDVTGIQCKSKMAGLKNTYKSVKDHNAKSGNSTRRWKYFNIMDEIFNKKPWITPMSTLDSGKPIPLSSEEDCDSENSNPSATKSSKWPTKRKRQAVLKRILEENTNI